MGKLLPLFPSEDVTRVSFERDDQPRQRRFGEPGTWFDGQRKDYDTGILPALEHIVTSDLTGNVNTEVWTVEVVLRQTRYGAGGADWIGPATITFTADGGSNEDLVDLAVAAANSSATLATQADVQNWNRFRSIVVLTKHASVVNRLVATSRVTGQAFDLTITPGPGGAASGPTVFQDGDAASGTLTAGTFVTVTGRNTLGRLLVRPPQAGDTTDGLVGPVMLDHGTEAVDTGYKTRVYRRGVQAPIARYERPNAYATKAIPVGSVGTPVWVALADDDEFESGMVTDAAGAAAGADANLWTMTPVVVNDTVYSLQVVFGLEVVVLTHLSDGTATATEICDGMRTQLELYNIAGGPLEGIVGSGTTTFIATGPGDGRSFTPSNVGVGDMGPVETTAGVQTHILAPQGATFVVDTRKLGSAPVQLPHPN